MNATTYTPRPGSTAERAKLMLMARGEMSATALADAIDCEPAGNIHAGLAIAVREGYIGKRIEDGVAIYMPEPDEEASVQRVVDAKDAAPPKTTAAPSVFQQVAAAPTSKPEKINTRPKPGDQPRSERGREGMEPEACESAAGRGTTGAPALATLPHYESPGVGPMGARQPADAGPPAARPFRCGVFSDGELLISKGSCDIVLQRAEFETLLEFLRRMTAEEA